MAAADLERRRDEQRALIVATARSLAEHEGWDAVTTRRLSTEIGFSQPVIYKHFASMDQLVDAVAVRGFGQLADALHGLVTLADRGRLRPDHETERMRMLVASLT